MKASRATCEKIGSQMIGEEFLFDSFVGYFGSSLALERLKLAPNNLAPDTDSAHPDLAVNAWVDQI